MPGEDGSRVREAIHVELADIRRYVIIFVVHTTRDDQFGGQKGRPAPSDLDRWLPSGVFTHRGAEFILANTPRVDDGGGVNIQARLALNSANLLDDEQGAVTKKHSTITLDHLQPGEWWWD